MRYFPVPPEQIHPPTAEIAGDDARHISTVLRLQPGDEIYLSDGRGWVYRSHIESVTAGRVSLRIAERMATAAESPLQITMAQALLKERKMDGLVRQLTEIGVHRWCPFPAARSVPVLRQDRLENRCRRWQRISREAVKQCRRTHAMEITPLATFDAVLESSRPIPLKLAFWEEAAAPLADHCTPTPNHALQRSAFVIIGPEGGFTRQEMAAARDYGFIALSLGPRILRAETATLAAAALVQHRWGDMA